MDDLRLSNVGGAAFEAATRQELDCKSRLSEIPRGFLSGDEASVGEQADKDAIVRVHQIVSETRPALEKLFSQAQSWSVTAHTGGRKSCRMRQALASLGQSLDDTPPELVVDPLKTQFDQLSYVSENLHATLARLEVESMPSVAEEAGRVFESTQQIDRQLKQARQKSAALAATSDRLVGGPQTIVGAVRRPGDELHPSYPVGPGARPAHPAQPAGYCSRTREKAAQPRTAG